MCIPRSWVGPGDEPDEYYVFFYQSGQTDWWSYILSWHSGPAAVTTTQSYGGYKYKWMAKRAAKAHIKKQKKEYLPRRKNVDLWTVKA